MAKTTQNKASTVSAREAAFQTLLRCERDKSFSNIETNIQIKRHSLTGNERGLFTAMVKGVIEKRITLDYHLSGICTRPLETLDTPLLIILRMGAYQLLFFDRIPAHAAVNECVLLAKKHIRGGSFGFVNGVLRRLARCIEAGELAEPKNELDRLSIKYSVPIPLIKMWREQYGAEATRDILAAFDLPRGITLHINTQKTTVENIATTLKERGIEPLILPELPRALELPPATAFEEIEDITERGLAFVQDASSQSAAAMLGARKGDIVVDTCACPGGKSFAVALDMKNTGRLYSFDLHKNKLSLIDSTAEKLGITVIETAERNAKEPDPELFGKCDRVLCDVPCSGFGIIAKKPEIRYRDAEDTGRFSALGLEILNASANYCKAGGSLLFSTCTLNRNENDLVAQAFAEENTNFVLEEKRTFFPTAHNDGFFAARFKRIK